MSEIQTLNLDIQCAELGRRLANIRGMDEKTVNALISVLEEQGPYAMFLYLYARHNRESARLISKEALDFLKRPEIFGYKVGEPNNILDAVKNLAGDLDDLLFARDLLRTAFSYARYHLKAKGSSAS